ncbi:MAG: 6,7-dimethyl-8-ribityllumazine synthase, partial [Oligoflexia bacterium]|nr:6,7-dimethyl-8-ribityllumazine synthase [Oligoflexia bacterium]
MSQIAVVCSKFNKNLVEELYQEAEKEFKEHSQFFSSYYPQCELKPIWTPGAGEIPLTVKWIIEQEHKAKSLSSNSNLKAKSTEQKPALSHLIGILTLGVIIKGQTGHYDFLNGFLQKTLWDLQKAYSLPIVFSILLLENRDQAKPR